MLGLRWEADALLQFELLIQFVRDRDERAAEALARRIGDGAERIRHFPESGRPGRVDGTRELIVHPNYLVVYQIVPESIDIIRLLHSRQRYP
ncbi:type II toxin-antitoxin system RelE/ParE family toxin [Sphingomonas suaedae]|uniref:Type II toxin-antitoxin system RelE/ParE family toxin n=1 Tax=Sphingomonas suaedae TaxID=2599297 RepID=A0A518RDH2_9SPHN|nr:type II toxin-antitoxin system RelE/ParE family toxin [Sphingomonas suaedae]